MAEAPRPPEISHTLEAHGDVRTDPYFWMRERENPKVIAHLEAENAYTEAVLAPAAKARETVLAELKARLQPDDSSLPFRQRGYYYYRRFEPGTEYPLYCRRKGALSAPEELLLDVNAVAAGKEYTEVHFPEASPDSTKIIYAADFAGRRFYDLHVVDLATGATLAVIPRTTGEAVWAADSRTILFARQDEETLRACQVYRQALGGGEAELLFEEADETFEVSVADSRTGSFLYIVSSAKTSSEWRVLPSGDPRAEPLVFHPREKDHEYTLEDGGEAFYVLTNWEATNFRLMRAPHGGAPKESWAELVPHRADTLLESADFFATHFALGERFEGQTRLAVVDRASGARREIGFPDPVYVAGTDVNQEFGARFLRYRYESLHRPASIYDYDFALGTSELRRVQPVPTYRPDEYVSERRFATARDGTRVPVSLVYRKGFTRDGKAPLFVYGYGSYGFSMEPWFQSDVVSLLDRGFVYAIAHVRGGSEMGRSWYDDGKLLRKRNTFTDFIDVAEFLLREKYGDRARVYASGASAGGLLMGVVANERPELFRGIVAGVPFVDVLTTMLDESIPLTTSEYDEWGDPREAAAYRYMASYSPYDNVRAQPYPSLLITAGLHDSQVQYWEPAKWAAKLRKLKTNDAVVLLHTEMDAGHGGASGRFEALEQTALEHTFFLLLDGQT